MANIKRVAARNHVKVKRGLYSMSDLLSESYRLMFDCERGSKMHQLVESHLQSLHDHPTEVQVHSRNLNILKELSLKESEELDIRLSDINADDPDIEVEEEEEEVVEEPAESEDSEEPSEEEEVVEESEEEEEKEIEESDEEESEEKVEESEDEEEVVEESEEEEELEEEEDELTPEELEELSKHLKEMRKRRKMKESEEAEEKEDEEEIVESESPEDEEEVDECDSQEKIEESEDEESKEEEEIEEECESEEKVEESEDEEEQQDLDEAVAPITIDIQSSAKALMTSHYNKLFSLSYNGIEVKPVRDDICTPWDADVQVDDSGYVTLSGSVVAGGLGTAVVELPISKIYKFFEFSIAPKSEEAAAEIRAILGEAGWLKESKRPLRRKRVKESKRFRRK